MQPFVPTSEQIFALRDAAVAAQKQANTLLTTSLPLGYNVGQSVAIEGGSSAGPTTSFAVWRFDRDRNIDATWLSSVAEVEAHLKELAALPRWCLDLVGNATVRVVSETDGVFTIITDTRTGQEFVLATASPEANTVLPIHAAEPPTIGEWSRCEPGE